MLSPVEQLSIYVGSRKDVDVKGFRCYVHKIICQYLKKYIFIITVFKDDIDSILLSRRIK